jgi:Cd2+/Zn2+-exporting ATPase
MAAEQSKIETGKIVDRYAAWFTPVILSAAVITYLISGRPETPILR